MQIKIIDDQGKETNEETDIALVKIPITSFTKEELNSIKPLMLHPVLPKKDEKIYIVGNPEGTSISGSDEIKTAKGTWLDLSGVTGTITDPHSTSYFLIEKQDVHNEKKKVVHPIISNKFIESEGERVFVGNSGSLAAQIVNGTPVAIGLHSRSNNDNVSHIPA